MADKKPFYQPWNEDEFQSGLPVRSMNHVQKWMYKSLLQSSFFCHTSPYLPLNDKILWKLAGAGSEQEWVDNKDLVLDCFDLKPDDPTFIGHHRVIADWNRVIAYRKKMRKLGKRSAEAKRTFSGGSAKAQPIEVKESEVELEGNERKGKVNDSPLSLEQFADKVL